MSKMEAHKCLPKQEVPKSVARQETSEAMDAQSLMAKHRGRTKKGRIAAALSEALKKSGRGEGGGDADSSLAASANLDELLKITFSTDSFINETSYIASFANERASHGGAGGSSTNLTDLAQFTTPQSSTTFTTTTSAPSTTTTTMIEPKRSDPRSYRKRLIQSAVSSQPVARKPEHENQAVNTDDKNKEEDTGRKDLPEQQLTSESCAAVSAKGDNQDFVDQMPQPLHSPFASKRKKKGKARYLEFLFLFSLFLCLVFVFCCNCCHCHYKIVDSQITVK
jgi:hypothetical protein